MAAVTSEHAIPTAPPLAGDEQARAMELRAMKWRATGLLVAVTAVFVLMRIVADGTGFAGYVEAAAEAAMVGGIADWFAVTALFRHPLGIPIPHTAIIPNRKDQIGRSLGNFVQDNFLNGDLVAARLSEFGVTARLGTWMSQPANAARVGGQASAAIGGVTQVLDDDDVASGIEAAIRRRLEQVQLSAIASQGLQAAIDGGHHQVAFDAVLRGLDRVVAENDAVLRRRIYEESPWWVPETIDDRVFDKIIQGIHSLVADVLGDPNHELRVLFDQRLRVFVEQLQTSPEMIAHAEQLKHELLAHPEVRGWLNSVWDLVKTGLLSAADDPDSELRRRLEGAIVRGGETLATDPDLRSRVDGWIEGLARYAVEQSGGEVAGLIASTVERWDARQTGERIELQVGRDLQFIRINGTVVGGLAGVAIHAIGSVL